MSPGRLRWRRTALLAAVVAGVLLLIAATAYARPGGGSSYSGGSSSRSSGSGGGSSSSGGGSDAGELVGLLLWLCIEHPVIGIPLTIIVIIYFVVQSQRKKKYQDWSSGDVTGIPDYVPPPRSNIASSASRADYGVPVVARSSLDEIRRVDDRFSRVVFEDFLYSLYAEVHRARGLAQLDRLSAYLSADASRALKHATTGPVEGVIVGAMRVISASSSAQGSRAVIEFESNYTEAGRGYYVVEQWTLSRAPGVKSRTPDKVRMLGCPSCGAPQEALFGGSCKHCARVVNDGAFDWTVQGVHVTQREQRPPILTANVAEQGTDLPTLKDAGLPHMLQALRAKDAGFDVQQFQARVGLTFQQFQIAWSARNLAQMRPFLSDGLFTTQQYWVSAYLAQHLRNVTDGARITKLELVKGTSDPYFDALTVRLYASSLDYTVSDDGKLVSGDRSTPRVYSEYWTFIRGTHRKGPARTDLACVNCGGPLDVNMAGQCKFCNVKVTTGDFDWVLSRIEQDESYTG